MRLRVLFEESLKRITQKLGIKPSLCLITYEKGQKYPPYLIPYLKEHLKRIGFTVKVNPRPKDLFLPQPNDLMNAEQTQDKTQSILYLLPEKGSYPDWEKIDSAYLSKLVLVYCGDSNPHEKKNKPLKDSCFVNILGEKNYYFSFFEILKLLFPRNNFEGVIEEFGLQYDSMLKEAEVASPRQDLNEHKAEDASRSIEFRPLQEKLNNAKNSCPFLVRNLASKRKNIFFLIIVFATVVILPFVYRSMREGVEEGPPSIKSSESLVRSELVIPSEPARLERPELMAKIAEGLKSQNGIQTVALVGTGGAGKTTLARQYARQQKDNIVWEINAETQGTLLMSFENLANALCKSAEDKKVLKGIQEIKSSFAKQDKTILFVREKLRVLSYWLLIFDNMVTYKDIKKYLPTSAEGWGQGKIILTTRNNNFQNNKFIQGIIQVEALKPKQKVDLFLKILNMEYKRLISSHQDNLKKFLEEIPPYPLDIFVAAAYLKTSQTTYQGYLHYIRENDEAFEKIQKDLLQESGDYIKTRFVIITQSLKKIIEKNPDYRELILLICLLDSQDIPKRILDMYKDPLTVDALLHALQSHSLITSGSPFTSLESRFSIHRVTQYVSLAYLIHHMDKANLQKLLGKIASFLENQINAFIKKGDIIKIRLLANHCESLLTHKNLLSPEVKGLIECKVGCLYNHLKEYNKSKDFLEMSLTTFHEKHDKYLAYRAHILSDLGDIYRELGHHEKGQVALLKSIEIYKTKFPDMLSELALALVRLGNIYRRVGSYTKAQSILEESIRIYESQHPPNHSGYAKALVYFGVLHRECGNYDKFAQALAKSLNVYQRYTPANLADIALSLMYLGNAYIKQGKYIEAKNALEQSLETHTRAFPCSHHSITKILGYLSESYIELGEYRKAVSNLGRVISIYEKNFPEGHIDMGWISTLLGQAYNEMGNYKKAQFYIEQGLRINKHYYPKNHVEVAWVNMHLADAYRNIKNNKRAINIYQNCLNIFRQNESKDWLELSHILNNLGEIYLFDGQLESANTTAFEAYKILKKMNHPKAYKPLETLAEIFRRKALQESKNRNFEDAQAHKAKALRYAEEAYTIIKNNFFEDSPHCMRVKNQIKYLKTF